MEREIKFRGKRLDNGEWAYGFLCEIDDKYAYLNVGGRHCVVDPATVRQYTGLKDKNGKEIYEGDIWQSIAHPDKKPTVVKWLDSYYNSFYQVSAGYGFFEPMQYVEVIGNIYENPELVNQGL